MSQITPFVKRMRTQGGTMYTFSSAVEDIGLNINERNNIVKMSHFALLDIPEITAPENLQQNRFNTYAIDGALQNFVESDSTKDGRVVVAESFQNYALNLESWLLSQDDYNPALLRTVSERVFWKWMKETGAVRWTKGVSNAGYFIEEVDTDSSVGYNSVVKYVGEISAGSVRTDTFGTYNETYVLVPTSHGQTRVYFRQVYDDNYAAEMAMGPGGNNINGRDGYTQPHPDGLSFRASYDGLDVSTSAGGYNMFVDTNDGVGYREGWWYSEQGLETSTDDNFYFTDSSIVLVDPSTYNYTLKYEISPGNPLFEFQRSNIDALGIEYNLNNLKTLFADDSLTFDKMAIEDSVDDQFDFNAVLIYYTVYNKTLDKILATNLLGILFLDAASGNTSGFPDMQITIPTIQKLQSTGEGFGSSYSFRINIKSDNMIDDTQATIFDESTSSQDALQNYTSIFAGLQKSLAILNTHTGTINYITEQYMDISSIQTQQADDITDLQYQLNDLNNDLSNNTPGFIPMAADGDDPLIDSSIFQDTFNDRIGIFTSEPSYGFQVETKTTKVKELIIENAIRDTSGNLLLGYGSPIQLGSSTNYRQMDFYTGENYPVISILEDTSILINGNIDVSGNFTSSGNTKIVGYLQESSLGNSFFWKDGNLDVSVVGGGGGAAYLSDLLDVNIGGDPLTKDGSVLVWDKLLDGTGKWTWGVGINKYFDGDTLSINNIENYSGGVTTIGNNTYISGILRVSGAANQIQIVESDNADKEWDVHVTGGEFKITEIGVADRMTIDGSGNVGIGKTNTNYTVDISGNLNVDGSIFQNGVEFTGGAVTTYNNASADRILTSGGAGIIDAESTLSFSSNTLAPPLQVASNGIDLTVKGGEIVGTSGTPVAGNLTLSGGDTNDSKLGGKITLGGGTYTGAGGDVTIEGGAASGVGGSISINGGNAFGTDGTISIGTLNNGAIYLGSSSTVPTATPGASELLFADTGSSYALKRVSGALPVAAGGTGQTTLGSDYVLTGTGTSGITAEANLRFSGSNLSVYSGATEKIRITNAGQIDAIGDIVAYSSVFSDIRLKENILPLENSLDKILQLEGISYNRKINGEHHIGVIAQEVEKVIPEVIFETPLPLETNDEETLYKTVRYQELIPYLIESIKEQQQMINELKEEIKIIKNK